MIILQVIRMYRRIRKHRAVGVGLVLALLATSIFGNSVTYHLFDGRYQGMGFGDAIWYSCISITTIGYGDISAQSPGARVGTILFIVVFGLATFSVALSMGIEWAADQISRGRRGMCKVIAKDHVLLINFPSETRVLQLIQELKSDREHCQSEIVIISDSIEQLPFDLDNVLFVRGSVLEHSTYERAKIEHAKMAIVLATSYEDSSSDAVVASAVSVLDSLKPSIHIVAECLNPKHRMLFDSVNCDAIIYSLQISGNLLAQEVHDPGVAQLLDTITSNTRGTTLYSTGVTDALEYSYQELAKRLLDCDINLMCVNRGDDSLTSFASIYPQPGDRVIYAADHRRSWQHLMEKFTHAPTY